MNLPERYESAVVDPGTDLFREVWRLERQLAGRRSPWHRVGHDGWPEQELVRFRSSPKPAFPGQDLIHRRLESTEEGFQKAELTLGCFGLIGARGALPGHYTELVLTQIRHRSLALGDFLDLFHHRLLSLLYRSWEKTRPAVHQERDRDDVFTRILQALTGSRENLELHYGAVLARSNASQSMVRSVMEDLTAMPVSIRALQGGWQAVADQDQTRLPSRSQPRGQYAHLGESLLGRRVWMADQGAAIVFRPCSPEQVASLLPGGRCSTALVHLSARLLGGMPVRWLMQADASQLPATRLGRTGRLGRDSFIPVHRFLERTLDIPFKPAKDSHSCQP